MSLLETLRGGLRRVDVRVASLLALLFAPLVAALLFALYLFAADEFLELASFEADERLAQLEVMWNERDAGRRTAAISLLASELARDAGGFRVLDASGGVQLSGGDPRAEGKAAVDMGRIFEAIRLGADDMLGAQRTLASGERLEVFISSAGFVRERDEVLHGFWLTLAIGVALVALVAIPATWLALAPLRRATLVTASIDARSLTARLPTRNTQDDVDRHARAVNRLLDQIEIGFARLQAFSQDVAHELRTPVHRILNTTELRLLDRTVDGDARTALESIHRSAEQMARLVDGLLLLARSEGDPLAFRRESIDVRALCRTLEEMYQPVCEDAAVRFVVETGAESAIVLGETALLLRVLGNLIDNALANTPARGWIRLRAGVAKGGPHVVTLEVEDSGPGIPEEARERIFDRFVRLSGTPRADGVGLGLPIARAIVRAHGGEIELAAAEPVNSKSGSRSGGARFVVRLPRVVPTSRA